MASQNQEMLDACTSGDVAALQRLFNARNIHKGSKPIYIPNSDELPITNDLLEKGIANGNLNIVSFLLETYDGIQFCDNVIHAILDHPDLKILDALYNHDNSIVHYEWNNYQDFFVREACKRPAEKIGPLIHYAIEHGATLDIGPISWQSAVHEAIIGNHPLDTIEAMVKNGGLVTYNEARIAIVFERLDVVEFFMQSGVKLEPGHIQEMRSEAEKDGNVDLIKLVNQWISSSEDECNEENQVPTGLVQRLKGLFKKPVGKQG